MKLLHIICFWLSVSLGLLIFIQIPIIKFSTPNAVKLIEDHCLPKDLTDPDTAQYQWARRWILFNENQCRGRLDSARHLGLGVCLVLLIQSVVGLRHERSRTSAEQECEVGSAPGSGVGDVERLDPGALLNSLVERSGCGGPGALEEK